MRREQIAENRSFDQIAINEIDHVINDLGHVRDYIVTDDDHVNVTSAITSLRRVRDARRRDIEHANDVIAVFDALSDAFARAINNIDTHAIDDVTHARITIEIMSPNDTITGRVSCDTRDDDDES